jgi:glycolate oxidase FAD binding subunit
MTTALISALREQVLEAAAHGGKLRPHGSGSKDFLALHLAGTPLDMRGAQGVIAYEPSELYVTAHAGTRIADIEALLADHRQMLAFEPPHFGANATLGGMLACGLSGPRRVAAGSLRDFVLGVTLMDGQGRVVRFGGQVMKNVAGFDVSRLIAGSFGTLGLILEITLKVLPRPQAELTRVLEMDEASALHRMREWGAQPLPVSATCWHDGRLWVRLSGAQAALDTAGTHRGRRCACAGRCGWTVAGRTRTAARFLRRPCAAVAHRTAADGTADVARRQGDARMERHAALAAYRNGRRCTAPCGPRARWSCDAVRGGRAVDREPGVFEPLAPEVMAVHRRLKQAFDPSGVFSPGRMYAEL